jgi:hypothetical protein
MRGKKKKIRKIYILNFYCLGSITLSMGLKGTQRKEHKAIRPIDLDRSRYELGRLTTGRPRQDALPFQMAVFNLLTASRFSIETLFYMAHSASSPAD